MIDLNGFLKKVKEYDFGGLLDICNSNGQQGKLKLNKDRMSISVSSEDTETYIYIRINPYAIELANINLMTRRTGLGTDIIKYLEKVLIDFDIEKLVIENICTSDMEGLAKKLNFNRIPGDNNSYQMVKLNK